MSLSKDIAERFSSRFVINKITDCHEWIGSKDGNGYGQISYNGKLTGAHRVSFILTNGNIPDGMFVCHKCDNPSCVNPNHLFLGTALQNNNDSIKKNRAGWQKKAIAEGRYNNGVYQLKTVKRNTNKSANSILTIEQVKEIKKRLLNKEPHSQIAKDYGISKSNVTHINTGYRWGFVKI